MLHRTPPCFFGQGTLRSSALTAQDRVQGDLARRGFSRLGDGEKHMTNIVMIPLSKLVEDKDNVRKVGRKDGIGELAASIRAQGLLQSLVVKETAGGKYAVSAGGRRLRALRLLAKNGDIDKAMPIPCTILPADKAAEASLAENVVRSNMHPADEIEAFARLCDAGEGPEAIGARFGVGGVHVARRLKLARVSPKLLAAFRNDELDLDQLSALAFSDDHAAQEAAFYGAPDWARTPERLKAHLTQAHVPETDKLARFVGVEPYVAAGGALASDLFAEDDETRWLSNRDLLVRLAEAKLSHAADGVRTEGWSWVEVAIDGPAWSKFPERIREQRRTLSDVEQAEQERLYQALDATEDETEIERIEAAIDALAPAAWDEDEVKLAGAVISLKHAGEIRIDRGLVRIEDVKALKALRRQATKQHCETIFDRDDAATATPTAGTGLPAKLVDELMAHKTLALRVQLASQPDLALRCVVLALAANAISASGPLSVIRLRVEETDVARLIQRCDSPAPAAYAVLLDAWRERLPDNTEALWRFIQDADTSTLFNLLAVLVAPAIELKAGRAEALTDQLCVAAGLDMSKWWAATVDGFFEHVRKNVVITAIAEVTPSIDRAKLEKSAKKDVLARVKRAFKGKAWLPVPLRVGVCTARDAAEHTAVAAE